MKEDDKKAAEKVTSPPKKQELDITAASVENAHATGDGAVKKTDELIPSEDEEKTSADTTPY